MRKTSILLAALLMFTFIGFGCKKDDDNPTDPNTNTPTVTGWWEGEKEITGVAKYEINIKLVEVEKAIGSNGGEITLKFDGPSASYQIPGCWGEHKHPSVHFEFMEYKFEGTMSSNGNQMTGKLEVPDPANSESTIKIDFVFNRME